jgi:hypothetical protein
MLQTTRYEPSVSGSESKRDSWGIGLRSQLCDYLVDIPVLVQDSTTVLAEASKLYDEDAQAKLDGIRERILLMRERLENWYVNVAVPRIRRVDKKHMIIDEPRVEHDDTYPGLLFGVLDCVANTVLVKLDTLLLSIGAASGRMGCDISYDTIMRRQSTARKALEMVRRRSLIAAKPLEFGLQQIWNDDEDLLVVFSGGIFKSSSSGGVGGRW